MKQSRFQKKAVSTRPISSTDLIHISNAGLRININEEIREGENYQVSGTSDPTRTVTRDREFTAHLLLNQYDGLRKIINAGGRQ